MGEYTAGVPGGKGSYERRGTVDLDAALARGFCPGEVAGMPFDEGFDFRCDVEILVDFGVCLADFGISVLDK